MALSYRTRKRWALVILLVGLPVYIFLAITLIDLFDRPPVWVELAIYVGLGFLWMAPFRFIFVGIGQPDPDAPEAEDQGRDRD
jgi:hypothetical protein